MIIRVAQTCIHVPARAQDETRLLALYAPPALLRLDRKHHRTQTSTRAGEPACEVVPVPRAAGPAM